MKLIFYAAKMPVKALSPLACPVVIDHAGVVKGNQNFITMGFVDLSVSNVWRIYGAYFPTLS